MGKGMESLGQKAFLERTFGIGIQNQDEALVQAMAKYGNKGVINQIVEGLKEAIKQARVEENKGDGEK